MHPTVLLWTASVILCVFKAVLLCDGLVLFWVLAMMFSRRNPRLRCLQPVVLMLGSLACPLACPEMSVLYLGTGPIWDFLEQSGCGLAGLEKTQSAAGKDDKKDR